MRVPGLRVEKQIGKAMAREMVGERDLRREYKPRGRNAATLRFATQVWRDRRVSFEQPENAALHTLQQPHPDVEDGGRDLDDVVDRADKEYGFRKSGFC